ncbi:MAG: protein BatD [Taibaiella sp.]|nr:protein BatD [Taibaiella sp.]
MERLTDIWRYITLSCLLLAGYHSVSAQSPSFTVSASAPRMGDKDQIQVVYTARDLQVQSRTNPDFKDFDVQGPFQSSSTNMSMTGNGMTESSTLSFTYVLHPRHTGVVQIPPMYIQAGGHTYQSNPVSIQVVSGSLAAAQPRRRADDDPYNDDQFANQIAAMQRQMQQLQQMQMQRAQQPQAPAKPVDMKDLGNDIFIKVTVDKNKVYRGEQITTSYKLYSRTPMQVGISKLPTLNGFWTQDFDLPRGNVKPTEEVINGKKYQVFVLKKSALFPQQAGTLELDPAEAQGSARILQQVHERYSDMVDDPVFGSLMMNDPLFNNRFFSGMAYRDVPVHLKSTPVKIEVIPLPEKGKPIGYGGAVGSFTLTDKIDKKEMTTDEAATLTLHINGSGNLKLIEVPKLALPNGLETFDPVVVDTITGRSTTISGSKIITYAITPHTPGDYDIPGIPFSYFDPGTGTYTSLTTKPIHLHVIPGKHYNPNTINTSLTDIHNIHTQPLPILSYNTRPLLYTTGYWCMYGFPLLAFVGLLFWKRREDELSKDTMALRSKRANKIALRRLVTAKELLQKNSEQPFYEEISKAIWLYLSDKLSIPLSTLSRETAQNALASRRIPADIIERIDHIVTECETALYASLGGTKQMQHTYNEAVTVISELEDSI